MHPVIEAAARVRAGKATAVETVTESLGRIDEVNPQINAFVYIDRDGALENAEKVDRLVRDGQRELPLAGVPFGVKDLDDCIGMPTSLGSLLFKDGPAAGIEPPLVARLRAAGAVPVGKTATPEFGDSAATFSRAWGVTRNPWRLDRTTGGSSGGSAAAVAAGAVPFATGTDAGGSIRSPASFCGLVGLKPSHGLIPSDGTMRLGLVAADYQDYGVLTASVLDTALLLNVAAGPYAPDRYSLGHAKKDYIWAAEHLDVRGLRVLWSEDFGFAAVDPEVVAITRAATDELIDSAGLEERATKMDLGELLRTSAYARDLRSLMELDGLYPSRIQDLGDEVREALERYSEMSFADQGRVLKTRADLMQVFARLFEEVDVIVSPATACAAFPAEDRNVDVIDGRDARRGGAEAFSRFANVCWLPAISVPAGVTSEGLPIGLQIMAPFGCDHRAIRLAHVLELARPAPRRDS